jgi:hypothetical protein
VVQEIQETMVREVLVALRVLQEILVLLVTRVLQETMVREVLEVLLVLQVLRVV